MTDMPDNWRVFIGQWDDQTYAQLDWRMTWTEAHEFMIGRFERWITDDCAPCAANAASQLPALRALTPDTEWEGDVEGDDYLITQDMGPGDNRFLVDTPAVVPDHDIEYGYVTVPVCLDCEPEDTRPEATEQAARSAVWLVGHPEVISAKEGGYGDLADLKFIRWRVARR